MKLLFVDEFKPVKDKKSSFVIYGLSLISIDLKYYQKFKKGFEKYFMNLGWSLEKELKGNYTYSQKIFDKISIEDRIKFAEKLMSLSLSDSGKTKRISTYISVDTFYKKEEHEIYLDLICRIFKKIPKPTSKQNGKNIVACFLDNNDSVTKKVSEFQIYQALLNSLKDGWLILEKPLFVNSSNLHPGIIFSDFVSYFFQNCIITNRFFENTKDSFFQLLESKEGDLDNSQKKDLNKYLINYRKKKQSKRIISILRDIKYV